MRSLALTGLVLILVLHLATFVPGIRIPSGVIPVGFLAAIVPVACMIVSANLYRPRFAPPPDDHGSGWLAAWGRDMDAQNSLSAHAFRAVPTWAKVLSGFVFAYVGVNILMGLILLGDAQPYRHGRWFWLQDHGRYVRDITESEFYLYEARGVRLFTGGYLAFAVPPVLWFTYVRPRLVTDSGATTSSSAMG